jgi:hypothetical protein
MLERWRPQSLLMQAASLWDGQCAHASFDDWCQAHTGQRCTLWLSSAWLFELVGEPGLPLADDEAAMTWARGLLLHYVGDAAADWPLASWQQGSLRGVSALRGVALAALRSSAARARVDLQAVKPWWSLVLPRALQAHPPLRQGAARLLVVEGQGLTAIELVDGRLAGLSLRRLDATALAPLQAWASTGSTSAAGLTLAIGYGLPQGPVDGGFDGISTLDALHDTHPAARWLAPRGLWA